MPKPLANLSDPELLAVANQTLTAMTADPPAYGATPAELTELGTTATTFDGNITDAVAKDAASKASYATKGATRVQILGLLRNLRDGAKHAGATEAQMAATGLPIGGDKVPPTATVPLGTVDTSKRLQHTISWVEATTPDNKRRPAGAMGCEIYVKLGGPPPVDQSECTFVTVDSKTPYVVIYDGADAGKMAHYMLRWRMADGSLGPWAETISATITG